MRLVMYKEAILDNGISGKAEIKTGSLEYCLDLIKKNKGQFVKAVLEEKDGTSKTRINIF
jgi:hypothetical protein